MKYIKYSIIIFVCFLFFCKNLFAKDYEIFPVAKVNKNIITNYDVMQRVNFIISSTGIAVNEKNFQQIFLQAREILIDEHIKNDAAKDTNITVSDDKLEASLNLIAQRNNLTLEKFKAAVNQSGSYNDYKEQIRSQLLWQEYLFKQIYPQISVSSFEIDEYKQTLKSKETRYKFDQIKFTIDKENEQDTYNLALDYYKKLTNNEVKFAELKEQLSGFGTSNGNGLNWYNESDIDENIVRELNLLQNKQISKPFRFNDNYVILNLVKKDTKNQDSNLSDEEIEQKIFARKFDNKAETISRNLKSKAFIERSNDI